MTFFLVGRDNNTTDTFSQFLQNVPQWNVRRYEPEEIFDLDVEKASLLIADLTAFRSKAVETIRRIKALNLASKLIVIYLYEIERLMRPLLEAGADGYLTFSCTEDIMKEAVRTVLKGDTYICPHITHPKKR